jgi:hypothetical protein
MKISFYFGTSGPQLADAQNTQIRTVSLLTEKQPMSPQNAGSCSPSESRYVIAGWNGRE